jgi:hypothetical protein
MKLTNNLHLMLSLRMSGDIQGGSNMTGTDFLLKTLITKVAQLLRSAACLQKNQSRSYLNHLVPLFPH